MFRQRNITPRSAVWACLATTETISSAMGEENSAIRTVILPPKMFTFDPCNSGVAAFLAGISRRTGRGIKNDRALLELTVRATFVHV